MRFDIGIAATGIHVNTDSPFWGAIHQDITVSHGYVGVPRLVVSKGLSAATISISYAQVEHTNGSMIGGTLDVPIINGGTLKPTLALRGAYATLRGIDVYRLDTYGLELFLGKGFGPVTPYGFYGKQRGDAHGTIPATKVTPEITLTDRSTFSRYGLGVQFNVVVFRLDVEATQAEERSYSAKLSFGF